MLQIFLTCFFSTLYYKQGGNSTSTEFLRLGIGVFIPNAANMCSSESTGSSYQPIQ